MPNKYPKIVANKFDAKLFSHVVHCPYCHSKKVSRGASVSTLIGYFGNGHDPNHVQTDYTCRECHNKFVYETRYGEAWYTDQDNVVLEGLPNCFENYILKCAYCGNKVDRIYKTLDGKETSILCYSKGKKQYTESYKCRDCGVEETLPEDDEGALK